MWLLILEAAFALLVIVFIMWWTLAPVKKREDRAEAARLAAREASRPDASAQASKPDVTHASSDSPAEK